MLIKACVHLKTQKDFQRSLKTELQKCISQDSKNSNGSERNATRLKALRDREKEILNKIDLSCNDQFPFLSHRP